MDIERTIKILELEIEGYKKQRTSVVKDMQENINDVERGFSYECFARNICSKAVEIEKLTGKINIAEQILNHLNAQLEFSSKKQTEIVVSE